MNTQEFNAVVERRIVLIKNVLAGKAAEYSSAIDSLHNFKVAARLAKIPITPEKALFGMLRKHLTSIIDMVDDTAEDKYASKALRDEKIGDTINYMILLEALFDEHDTTEKVVCVGTNATMTWEKEKCVAGEKPGEVRHG